VITKSPFVVCTVAVYFLAWSMTVGGGVVLCSMQVTISLSQPGANEVATPPVWSDPQATRETAAAAIARIRLTAGRLPIDVANGRSRLDILTGMNAASQLADEYDRMMAEVIQVAESCSDEDWGVRCPNEERTVGVLFDHVSEGNPQVVLWVNEFLAGRPVPLTADELNARNADHARRAAKRPRVETVQALKDGSKETSHAIRSLTDSQLHLTQEFAWAGKQEVAWVASAAFRHPRGHLKSIREALGR
jgi:hypothetical protein